MIYDRNRFIQNKLAQQSVTAMVTGGWFNNMFAKQASGSKVGNWFRSLNPLNKKKDSGVSWSYGNNKAVRTDIQGNEIGEIGNNCPPCNCEGSGNSQDRWTGGFSKPATQQGGGADTSGNKTGGRKLPSTSLW